jgi:hypothetical protein
MTYAEASTIKRALEEALDNASRRLKAVPGISSGFMGLTPDHVKTTREYQEASAQYEAARIALRRFNAGFLKAFKREYRQEIEAKRIARQVGA